MVRGSFGGKGGRIPFDQRNPPLGDKFAPGPNLSDSDLGHELLAHHREDLVELSQIL